jgi:hypothetical protein
MNREELHIYTIYYNCTAGWPEYYTVIKFTTVPGSKEMAKSPPLFMSKDLEAVRSFLPPLLTMLPPDPLDDPSIIESWI